MQLTSGTLYRHGKVLLEPEILEKVDANINEKKNKILALMKKFYKQKYRFTLLKETHPILTNELTEKLSIDDSKTLVNYYARDDDAPMPSRKGDIINRAKLIFEWIPYDRNRFLQSKGIEKDDIEVLSNNIPTYNEFIDELHQKIADDRMKSKVVRIRKLLLDFMKTMNTFKAIIHDKYGGNEDSIDDITHLSITKVKVCMNFKTRPGDNPLPLTKKGLLDHW